MGKLMIDEVIGHCERTVERFEKQTSRVILENIPLKEPFIKEYWEHRQVAEWLKELQAFKDKQEQGLLISLPVKEGTEVWRIVEYSGGGRIPNWHEKYKTTFTLSMLHEWGITVFATEAEAEEALAKMGGK